MTKELGELKTVGLDEYWKSEQEFTKWLSKKKNLALLSEEIGIVMELIGIEKKVGGFKVDILAKEEDSDHTIVIENQLGQTNHDHLGKMITYASGKEAETAIWIVGEVREEHQKAVEWLNEKTDKDMDIGFFLIKIELWQIDSYPNPAPKFNIIVKPNQWAKALRGGRNVYSRYLDFWGQFKEYVEKKYPKANFYREAEASNYFAVSIDEISTIKEHDAHITLRISKQKNEFAAGLFIPGNKDLFDFLKKNKDKIANKLDKRYLWEDEKRNARTILLKKKVPDVLAEGKLKEHFDWLYQEAMLIREVFPKYLTQFKEQSTTEDSEPRS